MVLKSPIWVFKSMQHYLFDLQNFPLYTFRGLKLPIKVSKSVQRYIFNIQIFSLHTLGLLETIA